MRSRYAAFALGLGEYLVATLASSHPDLVIPRDELVRELSRAKDRQRFLGLRIVHAAGDEVLFDARIFERGQDRSFAELSTFARENGAWRYASGRALPRRGLPAAFTYEDFVRAAGESARGT
jgi:SEC-C motif-containing protein